MATQILLLSLCVGLVCGHGRLLEPPSRASMWRFGFRNPRNYDDNALYCGGAWVQRASGGKCGLCGDNWKGSRPHEAGGKYANGIIVRNYEHGQVIDVTVELTANHLGWFEFRMCPNNNPGKAITQECLDRHLLELADGSGTRFRVTSKMRKVNIKLRLPEDINSCSQCVLQWKYNTGNSWGTDPKTGRGCLGCGFQEQFYGCADVSVASKRIPAAKKTYPTVRPTTSGRQTTSRGRQTRTYPTVRTTTRGRQTTTEQATELPPKRTTIRANTAAPRSTEKEIRTTTFKPTRGTVKPEPKPSHQFCRATGVWEDVPGLNRWCRVNCRAGYCPPSHCTCKKPSV